MPVCGAPTTSTSTDGPCQYRVAHESLRCPNHQWDVPVLEEANDRAEGGA